MKKKLIIKQIVFGLILFAILPISASEIKMGSDIQVIKTEHFDVKRKRK